MFLKSLSVSFVLVGAVVATVNLHVQDPGSLPGIFSNAQVPAHPTQTKFEPVGELNAVNSDQWTTLRHPLFPKYSARIKRSHFCDTTVKAYTGYIDFQAKHLFFYFFESRNDPNKDDVIFWTNGGPGCSSSLGLFMELGTQIQILSRQPYILYLKFRTLSGYQCNR